MASASTLRRLIQITHQHGVETARRIRQLSAHLKGLEQVNAQRRHELSGLSKISHREGLDYTRMSPAEAKKLGASFVCRYLSHDESKNLTWSEADDLAKLGIDCVVVWETTATRALEGKSAGEQDARDALTQAHMLRMPLSRPIYFAVDFEATGPDVRPYFEGVGKILAKGQRGAYGGYKTINYLFNAGLIDYGWQTYAWSKGLWDQRAQIQQYDNTNPAFDRDRAVTTDFGQWRPRK